MPARPIRPTPGGGSSSWGPGRVSRAAPSLPSVLLKAAVSQGGSSFAELTFLANRPPEGAGRDVDESLWYIDTDKGDIYERLPSEGEGPESWRNTGRLLPFVGDQTAPVMVTGLAVTPVNVTLDDGTVVPGFQCAWDANTETDIIGYELQMDVDPATWGNPRVVVASQTAILIETAIAGIDYDFRVRALDAEGFQGAWSTEVTQTALADNTAPAVPGGLSVAMGFKLLGCVWDKSIESDFAFYQLRFSEAGADDWTVLDTRSNSAVIQGLMAGQGYDIAVRAIDRSHNTATSDTDLTGLDHEEFPEAGWSATVSGTPALVGSAAMAFGGIVTGFLDTGLLSADQIYAGTLDVGGSGMAGSIELWNAEGERIAVLDDDGLLMVNPQNTAEAMWLKAGSLRLTEAWSGSVDGTTWDTAVTPQGLNASAITFGTAGGGSNAIPNAGFELSAFVTMITKVWTVARDWGSATSRVNLAIGGSSLTMTSAA